MAIEIVNPIKVYTSSKDGQPIKDGYLFIGEYGLDAQANPVAVYYDYAMTIPASQPIRIRDGQVKYNGASAHIYTADNYSVKVKDKNGVTLYNNTAIENTAETLRSDLANDTDPTKGVALVGNGPLLSYSRGTVGHKVNLVKDVEDFYIVGEVDSGLMIQRAIDYGIANSCHIRGDGAYVSSTPLNIREYRTDPPVSLDFAAVFLDLNQLTYTGSGVAVTAQSPACRVHIRNLVGVGSAGTTGFKVVGQGDAMHKIDRVGGFETGIHYAQAYSHTLWVGYVDNSVVGVKINGNAIKIYAGRIGGQYSDGSTVTDATTCDVGVWVESGANVEIHANIEYCRRTANSVGLLDNGNNTRYLGYLEGSNKYNLHAIGKNGVFTLLAGSNKAGSGVKLENNNRVDLLESQSTYNEVPAGNNTTLTFLNAAKFETSGLASISDGWTRQEVADSTDLYISNALIQSGDTGAPQWVKSALGAASWGAVTETRYVASAATLGYYEATRYVFPALPAAEDIYRINQSGVTVKKGSVNYGLWMIVDSGSVEVMIRLVESSVQARVVECLGASKNWVNVSAMFYKDTADETNALYEIQFRTKTGATIRVANAYVCNNATKDTVAPVNKASIKKFPNRLPVSGQSLMNGACIGGRIILQDAGTISVASENLAGYWDYPIVYVTGGWNGNLFIPASVDGHCITIKRDGVAATGTMQLLASGTTIDGGSVFDIAPAWKTVTLIYKADIGWCTI